MNEIAKDSLWGFTDEELPESAHICLVFDNEDQRRKIVSQFVAAGLKRGEKVRYLADRNPAEAVRSWLLEMGVELPEPKQDGPFAIMEADKFYFASGRFDPQQMIASMIPQYELTRKAGYTALRSSGEMSWALRGFPGCERLLEYESMLTAIDTDFPHLGMCQYDARLFDGATLFKILQVHPYMVARGQIVRNPFFVRPQEFAARTEPGR